MLWDGQNGPKTPRKGPKYEFSDTTVLQVDTRAAPPYVHWPACPCGYRGRIFALIPSFIGSERASNGVWALARILHLFFILDLSPSLDHPLLKRHPYHIYRYLGCQTIAGVKKSIFQLWSGIALGWLKWPKNTPKRSKMRIFGHHGATRGHAGCPPVYTLWVPWPYLIASQKRWKVFLVIWHIAQSFI